MKKADTSRDRNTLKRSVSLFQATMYGVGIILGAGIYALIGEAAGIAGNAIWVPFVIAALIAACSAISYAELIHRDTHFAFAPHSALRDVVI
jgi:APA family basic amino acid/polyamine antiporter